MAIVWAAVAEFLQAADVGPLSKKPGPIRIDLQACLDAFGPARQNGRARHGLSGDYKRAFLELRRREGLPVSEADLAKILGVTQRRSSDLISYLMKSGKIARIGGGLGRGNKPVYAVKLNKRVSITEKVAEFLRSGGPKILSAEGEFSAIDEGNEFDLYDTPKKGVVRDHSTKGYQAASKIDVQLDGGIAASGPDQRLSSDSAEPAEPSLKSPPTESQPADRCGSADPILAGPFGRNHTLQPERPDQGLSPSPSINFYTPKEPWHPDEPDLSSQILAGEIQPPTKLTQDLPC